MEDLILPWQTVLSVKALGNKRVFAFILPEGKLTPRTDLANAQKIVNNLKIQAFTIDIVRIQD